MPVCILRRMDTQSPANASDTRILRPRVVSERLGLSLTTLWRMTKRGTLPRPIQISAGAVGWPEREIEEFIARRAEHRR